ncbi:MAG: 2,4-dienoyl-CoA reductase-like NADH-dependent reductase (Old Yellow Enzyme family), partial [Candidatus Binatia bacterium]
MSPTGVLSPFTLGPVALRNRIIKAATYETRCANGLVTDDLIAWHRRFAAGGVGATTLAYCSVSADGRTFRDQIWMRPEALPGLANFCDQIHAEGAAASIQLGHAGWFADPKATAAPILGPSRQFSPHAGKFSRALTHDDLARILGDFVRSANIAVEAGFDVLEIHLGHGYLLSQFLTPWNNRRRDEYGGAISGRARFPRQVLSAVREAVGSRAAVTAKLNMADGFRGGLVADDAIAVARMLEEDGSVDALQLTGGHTTRSPLYLMRGDSPLAAVFARDPNIVRRTVLSLGARLVVRDWPFEEAWFRDQALAFRHAVSTPLMFLGGVTTRASMDRAIEDGFELVAMGRALIAEPDLALQLAKNAWDSSICTHCNRCVGGV